MGRRQTKKARQAEEPPDIEVSGTMPKEQVTPFKSLDAFESDFDKALGKLDADQGIGSEANLTLPDNPVTIGESVISAEDWAEKQLRRAAAAGEDWKRGVLNPRRNPIEAAIKADAKRKDRLAEAERKGKWKAAMERVDVDAMYETIEQSSASIYTDGIARRSTKIKNKIAKLQPAVKALKESIQAMPDGTDTEREQKMLAARRGMLKIGDALRGVKS